MASTLSGRVIRTTGQWNTVLGEDEQYYECKVRGKFRVQEQLNATNPIAVGDMVDFEVESKDQRGTIHAIAERRNYLIRESPRKPSHVHILAANLDHAVVVITIDYPVVKQGFVDRFLVTAEAYDIKPLIVINKNELYTGKKAEKRDSLTQLYQDLGYDTFLVSADKKQGLEQLKEALQGSTSLINGPSGVGKSTLLNAMYGLKIKTASISKATHKGKHITTFPRMYPLPRNTFIIDSPGIKEFGLVGFEPYEISHFFPEMLPYLENCKFNNCLHLNEPGCAVKAGLEDGLINRDRYESYQRIVESLFHEKR